MCGTSAYETIKAINKIEKYNDYNTEEYDKGYQARTNKIPFDKTKSKEWQDGWYDSNCWYQMND